MAEREVLLSWEGLRRLEKELEYLRSVRRREVAERIRKARQYGDVHENSEYEQAKNEQAFVEGRILTLERILRNARLVDDTEVEPGKVHLGSTVKMEDLDTGEVVQYTIVDSTEADPSNYRVSSESPVGRALLGRCAGEVVEVAAPAGTLRYRILEVTR